jgi:hypothetical protein
MKRPRPKYQVFVSSTYKDLHDERERVIWGILNARHIPAGMENFTATSDRGWDTIRKIIDLTDYYVIILAGKYGSIDEATGISWTHREYEYAVGKNIPVLGFIREDAYITQDKAEQDSAMRDRLAALKSTLRQKHLVQNWTDADDLARKVVEALRNHINDDEDGECPRPGWYRGDSVGFSPDVAGELARLSAENEKLRRRLDDLTSVKEAAQFEIVDAAGNKLTEYRNASPRYAFVKDRTQRHETVPSLHFEASVPPSKYVAFVDEINRSLEVGIRILNKGGRSAKDVVVDLEFLSCAAVELEPPRRPRPSSSFVDFSVAPRWKTDATEHAYIDRYRATGDNGFVRQRIKLIAPGVSEELVPFWVTAKQLDPGGWSMTCNYSITDSDGSALKGTFSLVVTFGKTTNLTEAQIEAVFKT